MKSRFNITFWIGLLVSIAGFLASQSQRIQSLLVIVSPTYVEATSGKSYLLKVGSLKAGDRGFDILSKIFVDLLAKENSPESIRGVQVDQFTRIANSIRLPGTGSDDEVGLVIDVSLSNQQVIHWSSVSMEKQIAPLKDRGIVLASSVIFVIGIFIQIFSRRKKEPVKAEKGDDKKPNGCKNSESLNPTEDTSAPAPKTEAGTQADSNPPAAPGAAS